MNILKLFNNNSSSGPRRYLKRAFGFGFFLLLLYYFSNEFFYWIKNNCVFGYLLPVSRKLIVIQGMLVVPLQLLALYYSGLFQGLLRYFRVPDMRRTVVALAWIFVLLFALTYFPFFEKITRLQKGVLCINFAFAALALCFVRGLIRIIWERKTVEETAGKRTCVAIFGAGDAGSMLCATLLAKPSLKKKPVVFFDDDPCKAGMQISGVPVIGGLENLAHYKEHYRFTELILAIPAAKITRVRALRQQALAAGLAVSLVPSLEELSLGRASVSAVRQFQLQDLLDRPPLNLNDTAISEMIDGKTVLVTGAGGSIGSEICRQVARCAPARLLLVERCEVLLYQIEQDLISLGFKDTIKPLIGDITDRERMMQIFSKYHPNLVFHAAAHKHVPMMESQPSEAIKNNSLGAEALFEVAAHNQAEAVVLISTDKAINPTSAMGASKRLAEIMLQSFAQHPGNKTRFMAVRFGNVLGSSGSVISMFKKQISAGEPLTVTHSEIKRYFMTIPEACGLVLQTGVIGKNGGIYVLDMGEPVKIIDIARHLIELSGLRPNIDIEIKITGLRPGEKLFEELKSSGENFEPSGHPRISHFISQPLPFEKLDDLKKYLTQLAKKTHKNDIKVGIQAVVPEYKPYVD